MQVSAPKLETLLHEQMQKDALPLGFRQQLRDWYVPLALDIVTQIERKPFARPLLLGLQGAQGTGKSTIANYLQLIVQLSSDFKVAIVSLDDFYLTGLARQQLAKQVHALLRTRGVPGTHDIDYLQMTLDALLLGNKQVFMPRFLKYKDDRDKTLACIAGGVDLVILEGWCVGVPPEAQGALSVAINDLEQMDDSKEIWRSYVNQRLACEYAALFSRLDKLVCLQAPNFEVVFEWRHWQEEMMLRKLHELDAKEAAQAKAMSHLQLRRFMAHFQRLTQHAFEVMPNRANWTLFLDEQHEVKNMQKSH